MPWLAPTLFGVAFGRVLVRDRTAAFRWIAPIGAACLVLFVALRASGGAGSFQPIGPGWIGFLNVTKYPPSFTFLLLTLGTNFVLLGVLERSSAARLPWTAPLRVFGSVPLFFFVAHLWLYAAMGRFLVAGTTIPGMYPYWLLGLVLLYLPCRWYAGIKQGQRSSSLLRLL
jgi:uncharacterized membrane protein